ncbi:MAG: RsmE family RNA methyltransferase [Clostridia bacterium]|jgi:RsmE family RNA methyltransferase|nr:RsmE family RNA methyltransferase [Spirochaetia bacterium]
MNMLVLDESEPGRPLPRNDRRVQHILRILKKQAGDEVLAGIADDGPAGHGQGPLAGQIGTARIDSWDGQHLVFSFRPEQPAPPLLPLTILLGFPRPIQANRILKDLASLGVARIILSGTELGEKSYFQSDFFRNREFRSALLEGAEQGANPRLPAVDTAWTLARALRLLDDPSLPDNPAMVSPAQPVVPAPAKWALDPYRQEGPLGTVLQATGAPGAGPAPLVLAIGSERGWTPAELDLMAVSGFRFAGLGSRILKTETAAVAATAVALARLGLM